MALEERDLEKLPWNSARKVLDDEGLGGRRHLQISMEPADRGRTVTY